MANLDFYFDVGGENDLVFDEYGDFRWTETVRESLSQRLDIRYKTWLGEWRYNTEFGTPYRQRIRLGGFTEQELKAEFISVALEEEDVISAKFDQFNWDRENRYMEGTIVVVTEDEEIVIPVTNVYSSQNIYPDPYEAEDFEFCSLESLGIDIDDVNRLHSLVETLPEFKINSWYNEWTRDLVDTDSMEELRSLVEDMVESGSESWHTNWKS